MIIAELPIDEDLRVEDLYSYDILDTQHENDFDELVELASQKCDVPISLITLIDKDRQWFKANKGLSEKSTGRDVAFCSHAILQNKVFVVENALLDERFFDNPLVTGDPGIRFYAGAPIISPSGNKLGTICIIDKQPKTLSLLEKRALIIISNQVTKLLDVRRKNILLRSRAKEIIAFKSNLINKILSDEDNYKKSVAYNLHEGFAQMISSSILFLSMADKKLSKDPFNVKAFTFLREVLAGIKKLSYEMSPPVILGFSSQELAEEFIHKISDTFSFKVRFEKSNEKVICSTDDVLFALRIIDQWLNVLAYKPEITMVNITLTTADKSLNILIEDDSAIIDFIGREKEIFNTSISDTVHSRGGVLDLKILSSGSNLLTVTIPLKNSN